MGAIEVEQIKYGAYGNCIKVSNGEVEFYATLDIGPRIIRFGKTGGPNEFFEDLNDMHNESNDELINYYGGNKGGWHIYGGHRLWSSPEIMPRTYYPDNRPVKYEVLQNGVMLIQEPQTENGTLMKIKATMAEDGTVSVEHFITNISAWDIKLAPWALTVLQVGGLEIVPQSKRQTGLLHNRSITLWPYSNMADSRVKWCDGYVAIKSTDKCDGPFKLGISNDDGYGCYFNNGNLFIKRFEKHNPDTEYPDNNVNFETYTCQRMTEIETVGEFSVIKPGETISHSEQWQLILDVPEPQTDDEVKKVIEKYITK